MRADAAAPPRSLGTHAPVGTMNDILGIVIEMLGSDLA
jgi:hypothetical protein